MRRTLRRLKVRLSPHGRTILALHDELEGILSVEESAFLYRAARGHKTIVEIGSYRGKSCVLLALGEPSARVTAIDPHYAQDDSGAIRYSPEDERIMNDALARYGVADRVNHITATSAQARPRWQDTPIDMLWIDGDHSYQGVRTDLELWAPLVRPGGLIAGHDYGHLESVRRAWDELITNDPTWGPTGRVRSIAWARKRQP